METLKATWGSGNPTTWSSGNPITWSSDKSTTHIYKSEIDKHAINSAMTTTKHCVLHTMNIHRRARNVKEKMNKSRITSYHVRPIFWISDFFSIVWFSKKKKKTANLSTRGVHQWVLPSLNTNTFNIFNGYTNVIPKWSDYEGHHLERDAASLRHPFARLASVNNVDRSDDEPLSNECS